MARKRKRVTSKLKGFILVLCIIAGLGVFGMERLPSLFVSTKEVISQMQSVPFEEITVTENIVAEGYYYQQMNEEEQQLYKEMYQGVSSMSPSIYMHTADMEVIKKISLFIFYDRPEIFWCTGDMQITTYTGYSDVKLTYTCTKEEKELKQGEIDTAVQTCMSGVSTDMTEYDRIKYVFEYIVKSVDYNQEAPDNQNLYSALVGKSSVCAGYSRAAQYLLQKMGITCIYVTGTVPGQGAHAWNIVKCNGQYYQMDVTFGDPVFVKAESGDNLPEQSINYDYLCCSDDEIMKNHTMDAEVVFPPCNSTDLNYFKLNGMYYEIFEPEVLLQNMNESIYSGMESFTCKFANDQIYQEARDMVLNDLVKRAAQKLLDFYGMESIQYTYVEDPIMNKITIFWNYQ